MRLLASLLLLLSGCVVRTGLCETSDDCDPAQVCNVVSHRCEAPDAVPDLSVPSEDDLAPPADLTPVPPDLSGDLIGTGILEVQRTGPDAVGLVRSSPAGVACGVNCTAVFVDGTRVGLSVEGLDQDTFFVGWTGACSGAGPCDVTVTGTVKVGATFKKRSFQPTASGVTNTLRAIHGLPPPATGAVFAVGEAGRALRWDGAAWTSLNNTRTFPLYSVWASAANNLWTVGAGPPLRWNGTAWTAAGGGFIDAFWGVFGLGASDIWAIGDNGAAIHWDGAIWGDEPTNTSKNLRALWGQSSNEVWMVGHEGIIQRWNGTDWKNVTSGTPEHLYAVWGAGASAVWAVGAGGIIRRWDGTRWSGETSPTTMSLRGVFGYSNGMGQASEVWAVGEGGVALRWRAGRWSAVSTGTARTLYGVWGERPSELWAVGEMGTILRYGAHP